MSKCKGSTYAPVGKLTTLRYLLSLAAQNQWNIDHLDVVTAFLNPEIDAEVYMQIPDGIEWLEAPSGFTSGCRFLRLNKALYGLRQAPKLWHDEISGFLLSLGLHSSEADPNLYIPPGRSPDTALRRRHPCAVCR